MKKIISFLAQKPRTVDIFVGLIILVGLMTLSKIRSNFLPPEPENFITISIVYRGASPQEIEEEVVNKIEDNLEGLKGIDRVTSVSKESFADIRVEMLENADPSEVLQDINNAVDRITTFPKGMDTPVIMKEEILNYTMTLGLMGDVSLSSLKDHAKYIKDDLLASPNLSQIFINGFPEEEIEVRLREKDLRAYELTFDEVSRAIQSANLKASGGELETGSQKILIRLDNRSYYAKGLLSTVIKATPDGKIIRLNDVAEVENIFADKPERTYVNGKPSVILKIFSRSKEDILQNAKIVADYAEKFNQNNASIQAVIIEDKTISLVETIDRLKNNAWQGVFLVLVVLGLFLHPRIAFWVAFKIPVALLGMFIISNFYDLTLNQVSLFGTIVVLGILVDDGVVVAENIYQHFKNGKNALQSAIDGTLEVVPSIISSLVTTALAFSLFFFLDGQLGDYFTEISFVVCATLFVALLESLFFLPVHIARSKALGKDDKPWKLTQKTNKSLSIFRDKVYTKVIDFSIKSPAIPIIGVLVIMILTITAGASGLIKGTFFPNIDQDVISARLELPLGTDESMINNKLAEMEKAVWKVNEHYSEQREDGKSIINYVERVIGPSSNEGKLNIYMMEGDTRNIKSFDIADRIREEVGTVPEATNLAYGSIPIFGKPVSIALVGRDLDELRMAKNRLRAFLSAREDLKDVTDTDKLGMPEVEMQLTNKAKFLGLTEGQVFDQVRKGFFGLEVQSLQRKDEEVKVWIRYDEEDTRSINDLKGVRLQTPGGASYPIEELATFRQKTNVTEINHQNGIREIRVEADIANLLVSVPAVLADAEATVLKEITEEFPNLWYTLEGEARLSSKTQNSSQDPSTIVMILMVTVLLINYRSLSKAIAILALLPFAYIGVAWGTFVHGLPVNIFSILGMIALWGILINNGLVLISTYNENIKSGMSVKESIRVAAISRFRPIVLTTITTVFGLLPLLLNNSVSSQFIKPTAIAIAYGLIFGTVLTLAFLPSVLLILNKIKVFYHNTIRRQSAQPEELDVVMKELRNEMSV
ncbi:efflux RND transporter permease subunit [Fulvivirga sp. M361]|uniref:efflux RND transporter permease subunit n=1 Tax=Fulvivirga sp. M361 TaxID=2594266 RepID=UPI001179AC32|nr:efflux RND transporter permease subunit [Fulvivirga sp. M361]TRX62683.1 efflux RND transporter permease subunit [Fulvivirga sp. M361]